MAAITPTSLVTNKENVMMENSVVDLFLTALKAAETNEAMYEKIVEYQVKGYKELHIFPGEYVLLTNPRLMEKVRIYPNGDVWESSTATGGEYVKVLPG